MRSEDWACYRLQPSQILQDQSLMKQSLLQVPVPEASRQFQRLGKPRSHLGRPVLIIPRCHPLAWSPSPRHRLR